MNILVTGGAGYIGYFVVKKLLSRGHNVTVLDNLLYDSKSLEEFSGLKNFHFILGSIGDFKSVIKAVKNQEAVIALAALVGDPACALNYDETMETNYFSTKCLLDVCEEYGVERLVFASSCSVYGDTKNEIADENFPLNPLSLYAETRVMSEDAILSRVREGKISAVIFRLATVFGVSPRMRFDLVVNLLTAMAINKKQFTVYGGAQWRPNVNVEDAANAFVEGVFIDEAKLKKARIFNVGHESNNLMIDEIGDIIAHAVPGSKVNREKDAADKRNYRVTYDLLYETFKLPKFKTVAQGVEDIKNLFAEGKIKNFEDDIYSNVKYLYKSAKFPV